MYTYAYVVLKKVYGGKNLDFISYITLLLLEYNKIKKPHPVWSIYSNIRKDWIGNISKRKRMMQLCDHSHT